MSIFHFKTKKTFLWEWTQWWELGIILLLKTSFSKTSSVNFISTLNEHICNVIWVQNLPRVSGSLFAFFLHLLFFWPWSTAHGILVPWPGIEPVASCNESRAPQPLNLQGIPFVFLPPVALPNLFFQWFVKLSLYLTLLRHLTIQK